MTISGSKPIATRVFQIVLFGNLISLIAMLLFAWWSLEQLESTAIEADRRIELDYFEHYGEKNKPYRTQSSQLISVFQPKNMQHSEALPIVFQNIPVPFQGEVELLDKEYSVITHEFPEGTFYIAKDLRLFTEQEDIFVTSVLLLAIIILIASLCLAFYAGRKISEPIKKFTKALDYLHPKNSTFYIDKNFPDSELNQIAEAINGLNEQVSENIKRERKFIAMASHELRTPIAVVLGAANVIENRNHLKPDDSKTLQRIITATREMAENTQSLLTMVRSGKTQVPQLAFDLTELLKQLCESYCQENPSYTSRIQLNLLSTPIPIHADRVLARIVIHNIANNALQHTTGKVSIIEHPDHIAVVDEGNGKDPLALEPDHTETPPLGSGMGLYIVELGCEALGWRYAVSSGSGGRSVQLWFA